MIDARDMSRKLILGAMRWSGVSTLAAPFLAGAGAILMLHRVNGTGGSPLGFNSHLTVSPGFLDRLLGDLKRRGLAVVSLDELLEGLVASRRGMVAITADDGWRDNLTEALPVFEAHDVPFTVFVAPGLASGEVVPWWEAIEELAVRSQVINLPTEKGLLPLDCKDTAAKRVAVRRLTDYLCEEITEEEQQLVLKRIGADISGPPRFMNWDEIRRLSAHPLATIGAHTIHHYNLKRLSPEAVRWEMQESVSVIEAETGLRPRHFAYPYGYETAVGQREVDLAREAGFACAVTTRHGVLIPAHAGHRHALPRVSVNGNYERLSYMRTLLSGLTTPLANRGKRLVTV